MLVGSRFSCFNNNALSFLETVLRLSKGYSFK